MTEHVELVCILEPPGSTGNARLREPTRLTWENRSRLVPSGPCVVEYSWSRWRSSPWWAPDARRRDSGVDRDPHHQRPRCRPALIRPRSPRWCAQKEAQHEIASPLGETATVSTPTWVDHLYSCRYDYPTGSMTLSIKELSSWDQTTAYFDGLATGMGKARDLQGLGQGAFQTTDGSVVVRKDWKVLLVDIAASAAPIRCAGDQLRRRGGHRGRCHPGVLGRRLTVAGRARRGPPALRARSGSR